jgi:hypothetical protein
MQRPVKRLTAVFLGALCALATQLPAQEVVGHATEQAGNDHVLTFELADGTQLVLEVRDGVVLLNGAPVSSTGANRATSQELAAVIESAAAQSTAEVLASMDESKIDLAELRATLADLKVMQATKPEITSAADAGTVSVAISQASSGRGRGGVDVGRTEAPTIAPESASFVGGLASGATNLLAVFISLSFMGLGFLFFAPRQLETVADTVWHSFWRSFLAGLFAQPLVLPAFGMMIIGLVLTVVGILVVPFAVLGFAMALFLAAVGGFIAVARSVGEIYLRRKMARGEPIETWGSYRYIVYGLVGLLALWLPVVLLGWIPVAGTMLTVSAALITWIIATAGFGATIISRAGMRGTFVRQLDLALTDEQYWTSEAMPTPPRHGRVSRR